MDAAKDIGLGPALRGLSPAGRAVLAALLAAALHEREERQRVQVAAEPETTSRSNWKWAGVERGGR